MKKLLLFLSIILCSLTLVYVYNFSAGFVSAQSGDDEIKQLQDEINKLNEARAMSLSATKPLEGQLENLKAQLLHIQNNLLSLSQKIKKKEADLDTRTEKIAQQQTLLEARVRGYYIRSFLNSTLAIIFSSDSAGEILRELSYRMTTTLEDQKIITSITAEITDLLLQKEKLEKDKKSLGL